MMCRGIRVLVFSRTKAGFVVQRIPKERGYGHSPLDALANERGAATHKSDADEREKRMRTLS